MPKDPSDPSPSAEDKKDKDRAASKANTLKRNQSCLSCRKRKLRCDAGRPTCATCIRSYNHTLQHLKAGQEPPPYPTCSYEELPTFVAHPSTHAGGGVPVKGKVNELEGRIFELESLLQKAVGIEGLGMLAANAAGNQAPTSSGGVSGAGWGGLAPPASAPAVQPDGRPQPQTFGTGQEWAGKDTSWMGPSVPGTRLTEAYGPFFSRLTPTTAGSGTSSADSPTFPSSFNAPSPAPGISSSSTLPNFSFDKPAPTPPPLFNFQQPASSSIGYSNHPQQTNNFPSSSFDPAQPLGPPTWPFDPSIPSPSTLIPANPFDGFPPAQAPSPSASFDFRTNSRRPHPSKEIPPNPTGRTPNFAPIDTDLTGDPTRAYRQSSGPTIQEIIDETRTKSASSSRGGGGLSGFGLFEETTASPGILDDGAAQTDGSAQGGSSGNFDASGDQDYFMDLLWPGWPSHLPSPGKLEHVVQSFFDLVPFATEMLSRTRFLTRLALPPTHKDFPHPALLHAICAVTARFLGDIYHMPPAEFHPTTYPKRRNELEPVELPKWDGTGNKPWITTPYIDEDFGEIHFTWAMRYVEQGKSNAAEWYPIVQALVLLQQYSHQSAKWVQGWTAMSLGSRLAIPLGLNARPHSAQAGTNPNRDSLMEPPKNDIDRQERVNLLWLVFCQDSFAAISSGWQGAIDPNELFLGLPTSHSTFPEAFIPPTPTQYGDDDDVLLQTPAEHVNSFALTVKGTILLRRIGDFIRVADMKGIQNIRGQQKFHELDALVTKFRASFPAEFMNPLSCLQSGSTTGSKALDHNLVFAHALPFVAIITLHDRYTDSHDPKDPSAPRMYAAARALLGQVYLLNSTNFNFTFLHPFMSYVWYLGAKTLVRQLQVTLRHHTNASPLPLHLPSQASLLAEINVFSNAINQLAERLPIGARQAAMLSAILTDVMTDPMGSDAFPTNNCRLILVVENATGAEGGGLGTGTVGTPSSASETGVWATLGTPPGSGGAGVGSGGVVGGGGGRLAKVLGGEPGHWLSYDAVMMEEMTKLKAPWEGAPLEGAPWAETA